MIFSNKIIIAATSLFAFLLLGSALSAQCEHTGQVVEPSNNQTCGKLILSFDTWELLVPTNDSLLEGIPVNAEIQFSYELNGTQLPMCLAGPVVNLLCVSPVLPPGQDCQVDFSHTVNFAEPLPLVVFEPFLIDYSAAYFWDFGDGNTSLDMLPSHSFPTHGAYEVCLSISGGICGDTTTACQIIDLEECRASFQYTANNGIVHFTNQSSGNYEEWRWSLGDGNEHHNSDPEFYNYGETNIYTVCLEVWNNSGCSSTYCDYVFTGSGDICDFASCVYPGDTNEDGNANVYDLLPIGVGFGIEGPPRQLQNVAASLDWSAQYAPNWGLETINGNDYKHLDCNGDGAINDNDAAAIVANYAAPGNIFSVQAPGSPTFWLDFEWDTILINDNTPAFIKLEADLMAGTPVLPMQNMTGFALQINYPKEMVKLDGVEVDYYDNGFLGHSNQLIWLQQDRHDDGQLDLGIVKKGNNANGFGKIATLSFIVISDVLGRTEDAKSFTISLSDVVAVNNEGAMLTIGQLDSATVHIVDKTTPTSSHSQLLKERVLLFPNPASDQISVLLDNLRAESLTIFNSLGQQVLSAGGFTRVGTFDMADWEPGVYRVQIKTDQGVVNHTLIVH